MVIDDTYSGISSVSDGADDPISKQSHISKLTLPMYTVDRILSEQDPTNPPQTVVFKIDVEGYEGHVLRGMEETLTKCQDAMGVLEFDTEYLQRAGTSPEAVLETLHRTGFVAELNESGEIDLSGETLIARVKTSKVHTDLLYSSDRSRLAQLRVPTAIMSYLRLSNLMRTFRS